MENIETLLAAVAQTQGFDEDGDFSTVKKPEVENSCSSPVIQRHSDVSQSIGDSPEVEGDFRPPAVVNPVELPSIVPEKKKRGRPPKGHFAFNPPAPKRKKEEDEEEDVCFICFDGGSLVLCDRKGCPKAYHPACIKRDEAFFRSKSKWNCGWHICSVCQKTSHYMCYTCTYSLCKGCSKDADYLFVRGNKGFCTTCLKTIMLIENKNQENGESVQVDFDDKTSWEYLFKVYWVLLKEKLSLTLNELTQAKKPQLNNVHHSTNDRKNSISPGNSELLELNNSQKDLNEKPKFEKTGDNQIMENTDNLEIYKNDEWASKELLEFVSHMKNGDTSALSQFNVQTLLLDYIKRNNLWDPLQKSQMICDLRLKNLFGKPRLGHIEMLKLLEFHFVVKEDSTKNSFIPAGFVGPIVSAVEGDGNKRRKTRKKSEERATQNDLNEYAAIDVYNVSLIYLRRDFLENLAEDRDNFRDKVVGSIVRIRISNKDQKPEIYRLVHVVGMIKEAEPYKIGDRTSDIMLEVLNLDKKEIVSIDTVSNQPVSEDECRRLRQSIRCGLGKNYTVGEVQNKAMALQPVRINDLLEAEILRPDHLRDRASEKGHKKELRECVHKLQLLKSPEERQRRTFQVPEIHDDPRMNPNYESEEDAKVGDNGKTDEHMRPRYSEFPQPGKSPVSHNIKVEGTDNRDINESKIKFLIIYYNFDITSSSGKEEESSIQAYNRVTQKINTIFGRNDQAMSISGLETLSSNNIETEKLWHYRDPNGKIQGPFAMMQLRKRGSNGLFPLDMRIWTNHEQYDSLLLTDAMNEQFHGSKASCYNPSSEPQELAANRGIEVLKGSDTDINIKQKVEGFYCNISNDMAARDADETGSSTPKFSDSLKDNINSTANNFQEHSQLPDDQSDETGQEIDEKKPSGPTLDPTNSTGQSREENLGFLPIDLSSNDVKTGLNLAPVPDPHSSNKHETDICESNLPNPVSKTSESDTPIQNSGILELLSPTPRPENGDQTKPEFINFLVPNWSNAPEVADEWCGYSPTPATNTNPPQPASNLPNWLSIFDEPIEFDELGEESVSDLLAEVDAMESQGVGLPSPTSAMKFAKELIQDCRDDCFSSINFGSLHEKSYAPQTDVLDSFRRSRGASSEGETKTPVNENGSEMADPSCWGAVQGNINLVTVQGNVNLVLGGGPNQGMANLGWGTNPGWGNPNLNLSPMNGGPSLPWDGSQRKYNNTGKERSYQGGRAPWGRPPYSGGGGGYTRPCKGQRVCKFYESGRCKKGSFCDYLHQ